MPEVRKCPQCGAEIRTDALQGLCPECLFKQAMQSAAEPGEAPAATAASAAELARHFPHLEIIGLLGQGGMGVVYQARQPNLDRAVALKILTPRAGPDPAFAERFSREARALARLSHPGIVAVYDFGQSDGLYYLIMEFVNGLNLRQLLRQGRLKPVEALKIVPQICEALQYAHDEGIVHRDIKPENILLDTKGRVKIADFGLAKLLGKTPAASALTGSGQVMGTLHYMAPEQMERPLEVDHRADIYSLGVVFYEMLTGELPVGRFAPPSQKVQVDVRLDEVVLRALERDPQRRYQHASDVKTQVEDIAAAVPAGIGQSAPAPAAWSPEWRLFQSGQGPLLLVCAIGMVLGALAMAAGVALAGYAVLNQPMGTDRFWGGIGAALGCFVGGGGSLIGSWNSYRQMEGASDLMREPGWTWLDDVLAGYTVLGVILLLAGLLLSAWLSRPSTQFLLLMGSLAGLQGTCFLVIRALMRRASSQSASSGRGEQALSVPQSAGSPQTLRAFSTSDPTITQDGIRVDHDGWRIDAAGRQTVRLFEVTLPDVEQCLLAYRADLKTENLRGQAFLETWCRVPGRGEFFSRGLHQTVSGTTAWARQEIRFYLKKDQQADLVKLNVVVQGTGTVWLRNIELLKTPLAS